MNKYIVVDQPDTWSGLAFNVEIISAEDYLTLQTYSTIRKARIFNLCQNYTYQSKGYYVSLLAEARGHVVLPTVKHLVDFKNLNLVRMVSEDFDELIQRSLRNIKSRHFTLSIYFGQNVAKKYRELCSVFHRFFQIPLMRVTFQYSNRWIIDTISAISLAEVPQEHHELLQEFTIQYFARKRYPMARHNNLAHDLAILVQDNDPAPPSNARAIKKFVDTAEKMNFRVEILKEEDLSRLSAFDALFIRMSTDVNNAAYAFARKAEQEGIALVDYPSSILRCCNKVYLAEALVNAGIETPGTMIAHHNNSDEVLKTLGLPVVLKSPDSTFSFGVKKADDKESYHKVIQKMLEHSALVIAQQYTPSDYDWRIVILDLEPILACRYYMARGHWQIYNWEARRKLDKDGWVECIAIENVPGPVIKAAIKAAKIMGDGLYGIDIKAVNGKALVIEINDNPNIDEGVEDGYYGNRIYQKIIQAFKKRIDRIA